MQKTGKEQEKIIDKGLEYGSAALDSKKIEKIIKRFIKMEAGARLKLYYVPVVVYAPMLAIIIYPMTETQIFLLSEK